MVTLTTYDRTRVTEIAREHSIEPHDDEAVTLYRLAHRCKDYSVSAWAQMHLRKLYREEARTRR